MNWTRYFTRHTAMKPTSPDLEGLLAENVELAARLKEAEDTLAAIRGGDVDALIVGDDIYTLDSANTASNKLRKDVLAQMEDAVLAFDNEEHVIFMNAAAARQYGKEPSDTLGRFKLELYEEIWPLRTATRLFGPPCLISRRIRCIRFIRGTTGPRFMSSPLFRSCATLQAMRLVTCR